MKTIFNLLTLALLTGGLLAAGANSEEDYFNEFERSLEELPELVQPPKNQDSRAFERRSLKAGSSLKAGNVEDGKIYARYSGASYCSLDSLYAWNCSHCNALGVKLESLKVHSDPNTQTRGYVAVNKKRSEIVVAFRGSANIKNWLANSQIGKTDINFNGRTYNVHRGFKGVVDALYPKVSPDVKDHLDANPGFNVVVTGHSLGAAIADLVALKLKYGLKLSDSKLRLYTYGGPRIGDGNFARFVNSQQFTLGRFVNDNDVVPHLPPQLKDYDHHHHELWVNGANTKVCGTQSLEDSNCSHQKWSNPSTRAHRIMWDIALGGGSC